MFVGFLRVFTGFLIQNRSGKPRKHRRAEGCSKLVYTPLLTAFFCSFSGRRCYCGKNPALFRCPADPSTVLWGGKVYPRVRSISMSQVFDWGQWLSLGNVPSPYWRTYAKISDIVRPVNTFVFIDENPTFLNDGALATECDGLPGSGVPGTPQIIDIPASYHNHAGGLSFADGHAEIHKWKGNIILTTVGSTATSGGDLEDFTYLAENTTARR